MLNVHDTKQNMIPFVIVRDRDELYAVVVETIIRRSNINRTHFMINCSYNRSTYSLYINRLILRDTFYFVSSPPTPRPSPSTKQPPLCHRWNRGARREWANKTTKKKN